MTESPLPAVKPSKLRSVFAKMTALTAVVGVSFVISISFLLMASGERRIADTMRNLAQMSTPPMASQVAEFLVFAQDSKTQAVLDGVAVSAGGRNIGSYAIDAKGFERAQRLEGADIEALKALAQRALAEGKSVASDDGLYLAVPAIPYEGAEPSGVVATAWGLDVERATFRGDMLRDLAFTFGILSVAMLVMARATHRILTRPLTQINLAVQQVTAGDYEAAIPQMRRRDEIGTIARSLDTFRRQLSGSALRIREGLFRGAAYESASAAMLLLDADQTVKAVNPALLAMMETHLEDFRSVKPEFDPAALIGKPFSYFHPSGSSASISLRPEAMPLSVDIQIGTGFYHLGLSLISGAEGEVLGYAVEWTNTTAEKRNAAVTEAIDARQLRAEFTAEGRLTAANGGMGQLLRAAPEALVGQEFATALHVAESAEPCFAALARGETLPERITLRHEGQSFLLSGAMSAIRNSSGAIQRVVMIASDITEIEARETASRAQRAQAEAEQRKVVEELRAALNHLAQGDLSRLIAEPFPGDYETLRADYNDALSKLSEAVQAVIENSRLIRSESNVISRAALDMSKRTEQQAATLEETAAALNQMTSSVKSASERTSRANTKVAEASRNTETSGKVVREAVQAMGEISESSNKISKITSVIEEISFQTNLLALNAGVEAARAGEAGRGFAVVASEVRALAQRSSDAAREIAGLISDSANQVKRGVDLVGQAGTALESIQGSVGEIVAFMGDIAAATNEQASGLTEINSAMLQLDQVTQQNAAMFEETTAASQALAREADGLNEIMGRFRVETRAPAARPQPATNLASAPVAATAGFRSIRSQTAASAPLAPKDRSTGLAPLPRAAHSAAPPPAAASAPPPPAALAPAALAAPRTRASAGALSQSGHRLSALAVKPSAAEDDWQDF